VLVIVPRLAQLSSLPSGWRLRPQAS
jgi:hypothetical protein